MFIFWFSANFNILAFSTGSSGPVFFSLGIKDSLLVILVVDIMCVSQKFTSWCWLWSTMPFTIFYFFFGFIYANLGFPSFIDLSLVKLLLSYVHAVSLLDHVPSQLICAFSKFLWRQESSKKHIFSDLSFRKLISLPCCHLQRSFWS